MENDKKIWDDFRSGESYALPNIYHNHIQFLYRYGKKFSSDEDLIKDTIQDLFFDLIKTRKNLGETDNILFYLLRSFRRKLYRNIQKHSLSIVKTNKIQFEAEIIYSAEHELIVEEEIDQRDNMIREALAKLSPKQREILFYRYTCEFEYDQICEIMQIKYDSARKQVFRALKALKEALSGVDILLFILFF